MTEEEKQKRREYYREYYRTHPEQRIKRNERSRKWQKEHRREWNLYQSQYQYRRRNGDEKEETNE